MAILNKTIGYSPTANLIAEINKNNHEHLEQSVVFGKKLAYNELIELWDECKNNDWDGYDAFAVQEATFNFAWNFIDALPLGYPLPSFGAEPDGHITLEWYRHPRWIFSVSVSPEGYLYYAALFGDSIVKGEETFLGEIPTIILDLVEKINIKKI